ncbi:ATP-binding protein [Streptomyces sp. H27-D2]|uniref:ATP-binding protein n=1 Tax=Streptomyces sp. H27-D2 TaxID=3046304 RepID=UPI002DBB97A5|nr:ATP-binding protein [Streptomyces sp. H27-D2]MEC4016260.1 ATP-binding protein [Streptomyces sp. H27-D2]
MPEQSPSQTSHYPCRPASVPEIRRATREILAECGLQLLSDDAELCVSELASNAVSHGSKDGERQLALAVSTTEAGRLRVEIHDAWDGLPRVHRAGADDENGRGLYLVTALATDWGAEPRFDGQAPGKAVWFELTLPEKCEPTVDITETGDAEYPYRIGFAPRATVVAEPVGRSHEELLTTTQALAVVSRLAPMLGMELGPARPRRGTACWERNAGTVDG